MASFKAKKARIQQQLQIPDEEYQDASPKGSVDENIRLLVAEINGLEEYVTTSSCGGRVAVYLDGPPKSSAGGKGGGQWLYTSHQPVLISGNDSTKEASIATLFGLHPYSESVQHSLSSNGNLPRFVHFKFEPMILHILTSSHAAAQQALTAAMDAGFRESGISGITSSNANKAITPMVAVRTTGLAFDAIIACYDESESSGKIQSMVSEEYLRMLVAVANDRFKTNDARKERFRQSLLSRTRTMVPLNGVADSTARANVKQVSREKN